MWCIEGSEETLLTGQLSNNIVVPAQSFTPPYFFPENFVDDDDNSCRGHDNGGSDYVADMGVGGGREGGQWGCKNLGDEINRTGQQRM